MARYFFHTDDHRDIEGHDYETLHDARCEAALYAGRLLCDRAKVFWPDAAINLTVSNAEDLTLFVIIIAGHDAAASRLLERPS